jgi:hypothetical protein
MHEGETFSGLLGEDDDRHIVLVQAVAIQGVNTADVSSVAVDGALILPRDRVAYLQRP